MDWEVRLTPHSQRLLFIYDTTMLVTKELDIDHPSASAIVQTHRWQSAEGRCNVGRGRCTARLNEERITSTLFHRETTRLDERAR